MESHCNRIIMSYTIMFEKFLEEFKRELDNDPSLNESERREKCEKYNEKLEEEKAKIIEKFLQDWNDGLYDC